MYDIFAIYTFEFFLPHGVSEKPEPGTSLGCPGLKFVFLFFWFEQNLNHQAPRVQAVDR